jgi:hypothetical protein
MSRDKIIYVTASEIADYIYCECCWWDNREGKREETEAMIQGSIEHTTLQRSLFGLFRLRVLGIIIIIVGLLVFLLFFISNLLGI